MKLLRRPNGRMVRGPTGAMAGKIEGQTCPCCGASTCEACDPVGTFGDPGYLPALVCTEQYGLLVNVSGVTLAGEFEGRDAGSYTVTWSGGASISGTFCVDGSSCPHLFSSQLPIKTGTAVPSDDLEADPEPVELFLHLEFICGGPRTDFEEPPGEGNGAYVAAYITGASPLGAVVADSYLLAFSTSEEVLSGTPNTHVEWSRTCDLTGYVLANAATTHHTTVLEGLWTVGSGGTVTTTGRCANTDCSSCVTTGLSVAFTGGTLNGMTLDADAIGTCSYVVNLGERYHGTILPVGVGPNTGYLARTGFELKMYDADNGDALVFQASLACDTLTDPQMGRYETTADGIYADVS